MRHAPPGAPRARRGTAPASPSRRTQPASLPPPGGARTGACAAAAGVPARTSRPRLAERSGSTSAQERRDVDVVVADLERRALAVGDAGVAIRAAGPLAACAPPGAVGE